jgi:hypothetical protein
MHLALGQELLQGDDLPEDVHRQLLANQGPFLLGNTAADVQTVSGQERQETHFYQVPRIQNQPPAYQVLLETYPGLGDGRQLRPAHAAFMAGYIVHLQVDEIWLDSIVVRYFRPDWDTWRQRALLHNALRTWMDSQDLKHLDDTLAQRLRDTRPDGWLPFVENDELAEWRDSLAAQLAPDQPIRTAEVFASRMGVPTEDLEAITQSPQQMMQRVFRHVPPTALAGFRMASYEAGTTLISKYLQGTLQSSGDQRSTIVGQHASAT